MELNDLIAPNAIVPLLKASSKKQVIQELSEKASALTGLPQRQIFDKLLQRERLGSTGVGQGVAIPHGKLAELDRLWGIFAVLDKPVNYETLDDQPVDIVFLLLAPEGAGADHLKALARVARVLRNSDSLAKLRSATDTDTIRAVLCEMEQSDAA
ncbi:MAG: PTS IIA-like nitrogen regulatory protein PtsN [Cohaesibacter sp.]|nr:PTS IIA-like nitrogen regulatory protein PtsN [Cohaesibacter sp.]